MKTFILGAGVSRGYIRAGLFPPTMLEFFKVAGNLNWLAETDMCHDLWRYLMHTRELKSEREIWKAAINIEDLMCELHDLALKDGDWSLYLQLEYFIKSLLIRTTDGSSWAPMDQFVSALERSDGLVTFNYDCLLEKSLIKNDWNPRTGYRMLFQGRFVTKGEVDILTQRVPGGVGSWDYLKLHGSLNWLVDRNIKENYLGGTGGLTSRQSLYVYLLETLRSESQKVPLTNVAGMLEDEQESDLFSLIIPPSRKKEYSEYRAVLGYLWELAKKKISESSEIVFLGFSMPQTDENIKVLFAEYSGRHVTIVNRAISSELRARYQAIFPSLEIECREETFEQYVGSLPPRVAGPIQVEAPQPECEEVVPEGLSVRVEILDENARSRVCVLGRLNGCPIEVRFLFEHGTFIRERFAKYVAMDIPSTRSAAIVEHAAGISRSLPCLEIKSSTLSKLDLGKSCGHQFDLTVEIEWSGPDVKINLADFVPKALRQFSCEFKASLDPAERSRISEAPAGLGMKFLI
jgi:hypothetical protein